MPITTPPPTATRVQETTSRRVNAQIERDTEADLARAATTQADIDRRLRELDEEWGIERVLQTNFGIVNLISVTVGALAAPPFFLLAGVAAAFMGQHALQGWCPPVPVFRRLGFRTAREIARERYALKALRGDFHGVDRGDFPKILEATNRRTG